MAAIWFRSVRHPSFYENISALALTILSSAATADVSRSESALIETGTTVVASASSQGEPEGAGAVAFDITASLPVHGGQFSFLIEAETSPYFDNVHQVFPNADTDHLQVAEVHYDFVTDSGEWSIGLIDSKAYIDISDIANDDKKQFSSSVFANNPTIGIPEPGLGLSWRLPLNENRPSYSALIAASDGSGAFVSIEAWQAFANTTIRLGMWGSSANQMTSMSQHSVDIDYGLYTSIDGSLALLKWNLRLGLAIPNLGASKSFIGIANEIPFAGNSLGIAFGRSKQGDHWSSGGPDEVKHVELYYRYELSNNLSITPCIQYRKTLGFDDNLRLLSAGVRFRMVI
ncbi:MAG: carbohydrate porin [Desulfobulbia bacterium]